MCLLRQWTNPPTEEVYVAVAMRRHSPDANGKYHHDGNILTQCELIEALKTEYRRRKPELDRIPGA